MTTLRVEHNGVTYTKRCEAHKRWAVAQLDLGGREAKLVVTKRTSRREYVDHELRRLMRAELPRIAFAFDLTTGRIVDERSNFTRPPMRSAAGEPLVAEPLDECAWTPVCKHCGVRVISGYDGIPGRWAHMHDDAREGTVQCDAKGAAL